MWGIVTSVPRNESSAPKRRPFQGRRFLLGGRPRVSSPRLGLGLVLLELLPHGQTRLFDFGLGLWALLFSGRPSSHFRHRSSLLSVVRRLGWVFDCSRRVVQFR